jgi:hypothetical protein
LLDLPVPAERAERFPKPRALSIRAGAILDYRLDLFDFLTRDWSNCRADPSPEPSAHDQPVGLT